MVIFGIRFLRETKYQAVLGEIRTEKGKVLTTEASFKAHRDRYPLFVQRFANAIWSALGGRQAVWTRARRRRAWRETWPMFHKVEEQ